MPRTTMAITVLIGIFAVSTALYSAAQFGGGFPSGGMRGSRNRSDNSGREQRAPVQNNSPEQVEDRLGMLEEDLHLTADQRSAWQAYAGKVNALVADIGRERDRGPLGNAQISALQQIDRAVDTARNRLTALEDIAAAAKTLYGNLTPQQKSVADPRLATIVSAVTSPPGAERAGRQRTVQ